MRILAVNAGSTSLKLSLVGDGDETIATSDIDSVPPDAAGAVRRFLEGSGHVEAVCFRLVHGGPSLRHTVLIDDEVMRVLHGPAAQLAPLHVPPVLALIDSLREVVSAPCVACFDTAFFARMPEAAATYAVPEQWRNQLGIRRYGFHGLSCAWSLRSAAVLLGREATSLQLIVAHLGGGCSVTAVRDGHGVDTTMGFSPLDGLVMATRSGSLDPAAVLWLQTAHGRTAAEVGTALENDSGLKALAGSADMRAVIGDAASGDARAQLALDVFVHRARAAVGAMAMSLSRVDAIVFTGGIGEHAATLRDRICAGFPAADRMLVVEAREDLQMATETRALLSAR